MKKYLGVDWGKKRIGLSLADSETKIATPFGVIDSVSGLFQVAKNEGVDFLVVGSPIKLAGENNNPDFEKFLKIIKDRATDLGLKIFLIDERLSSVYADSLRDRESKTKQDRDAVSAMIILQSYLDIKA